MDMNDVFCFYCQKQYTYVVRFLSHVKAQHPGVYRNLVEGGRYNQSDIDKVEAIRLD